MAGRGAVRASGTGDFIAGAAGGLAFGALAVFAVPSPRTHSITTRAARAAPPTTSSDATMMMNSPRTIPPSVAAAMVTRRARIGGSLSSSASPRPEP